MTFRRTSVAVTVVITIMTVTTLFMLGLGVLINNVSHDRWWGKLQEDRTTIADQLAESLSLPLWYFDDAQIEKIMESALRNKQVFGIVVQAAGKGGRTFMRMKEGQGDAIVAARDVPAAGPLVDDRDIQFSNRSIGTVRVIMTSRPIEAFLRENRIVIASILVPFELVLALSLYLLLWRMVLKPLKEIEAYAGAVSSGSDGGRQGVDERFHGELHSLRSSIEAMVGQLSSRYAELRNEMTLRRASEERFRAVYDSVNDAIFLHDMETGAILDVNSRTNELYGYSGEEIMKLDVGTLSSGEPPFTQEDALKKIAKAAAGEPQLFEWKAKHRDGRLFWTEVNMRRAAIAGADRIIVVVRDITERKHAEEELAKSEERFRVAFRTNPDAIIISRIDDGVIIDVNQGFSDLTGYAREDVLHNYPDQGPTVWNVPADRRRFIEELRTKGAVDNLETQFRRKDGNIIYGSVSARVIMLNDVPHALSIGKDITERKRSEEALRLSRAQLLANLDNTPNVAVQWYDEMGRILYWNPASEAMYGWTSADALGKTLDALIHTPEEAAEFLRILAGIRATGDPFGPYEARIHRRDGSEGWVLATTFGIPMSEGLTGFACMDVDITERKRAEMALRESEANTKAILEAIPDIMFRLSADGVHLDFHAPRPDALYLEPKEFLGKHVDEVLPRDVSEKFQDHIRKALETHTMQVFEYRLDFPEGPRHYEGRMVICGENETLIMVRNITDRKRAENELNQYRTHLEEMVMSRTAELSAANEKLKELDRLKSMFIASMSHELRTPLNSIIGFTGMTLQGMSGELNDEQKDNLTRAYLSAKHLLNLISDVIDISKIEAGKIETFPEEFPLREMIDEAVATVEPQLKGKGLTLAVDVPAGMRVTTDRKRLLQCLINFLSNAVKYTEQGGVAVASEGTGERVSVSVSDTGIGIAEKDIVRLFEPFERLETRLRVKTGGTGLGLYLTRKLTTDVLRGDLSIKSREGQGSTFTIRIPRDISKAPQASIEQNGR
jgi:PAS domain S-box-containing protein